MNYTGAIVEESLIDSSILKELTILQKERSKVTSKENTPWLEYWNIHTVEIAEALMDQYAQRLSELLDTTHCNDWYCDFRNTNFHYVIFPHKVFKLNRTSKQDYLTMQEYGIHIGLPISRLPTFNNLPQNLLIDFLTEAKKQTYANHKAKRITPSRLGSSDYRYQKLTEGELMTYHDTYFGTTRFIGEEVVYRGSHTPKWGMNYYGVTLDETLSEEAMDKALRPALMQVGEDLSVLPIRGPSRYENEGYVYTFHTTGTLENFEGVEEIHLNSKLIFRLHCHGGIIE